MLFLQYKTQTRIISLPDSLSNLINNVKIMFPSLKKFQIEYEANGQRHPIDSDEVFSQVIESMKNEGKGMMKFFVKKDEDNFSDDSKAEAAKSVMTTTDTETPKSKKELMKEKLEGLKNSFDEKIERLGKKFDKRISMMDESNQKKVARAIMLRDKALIKGAELSEKIEKKIRKIVE